MSELIRPKKEKKINIISKKITAPGLPSVLEYELRTKGAVLLKRHLEEEGVVIPTPVLEALLPAYKEIGQLYWTLVNKL